MIRFYYEYKIFICYYWYYNLLNNMRITNKILIGWRVNVYIH